MIADACRMDAALQAQDRCHRIGQTREVHIYRLVSERTIEENILAKSDQKRQLDHLAIQSGGFNTEFLQRFNPRELLGVQGEPWLACRGMCLESIWITARQHTSCEGRAASMAPRSRPLLGQRRWLGPVAGDLLPPGKQHGVHGALTHQS